jgi:hypothetical protein
VYTDSYFEITVILSCICMCVFIFVMQSYVKHNKALNLICGKSDTNLLAFVGILSLNLILPQDSYLVLE